MTILLTHTGMIISRQPEISVIIGVGELSRIDGTGYLTELIKL